MVFVLAPDSFKESLTAQEACQAMEAGIKEVFPQATCIAVPMADGGEGTMQALVSATQGKIYQHDVIAPLGNKFTGEYGILGDGRTAIVELASASGLHLVPLAERNPLLTTTYGTGELIKEALKRHPVQQLIIGIGGSATNDGGVGLLQALGVRFLDNAGQEVKWGGGHLPDITTIDITHLFTRTRTLQTEVACDVTNPLTGPLGASYVFGPQKGATPAMQQKLEDGLQHFALKIKEFTGKEVASIPGGGAAGGTGAGLLSFLNAELIRGVDLVIKHSGLEAKIRKADYVFTGEGSLDKQTAYGKTISGIVSMARKYNKPVIAFAGKVADREAVYNMGITAMYCITPEDMPLAEALKTGKKNLANTVAEAAKRLAILPEKK